MLRTIKAAAFAGFCVLAPLGAVAAEMAAPPPAPLTPVVDPVAGTYTVKGDSFDGARPYTGEVIVERTGATYRVTWYPGPNQIEGIGVFWGGQLSVGYLQEGIQGVAVYVPMAGGLKGVWSERGETRLAPEDWTRR